MKKYLYNNLFIKLISLFVAVFLVFIKSKGWI